MNKDNIAAHFLGFGVSLFLADFPILGPISTSRVGFALVLVAFLLKLQDIKKMPAYSRPVFLSLTFVFLAVLMSSLYHQTPMEKLFSWTFVFISTLILALIFQNNNSPGIYIEKLAYYSFGLLMLLTVYSINKYGIFAFQNTNMRYGIDELHPGLNRITNGIVFGSIYIIINNKINKNRFSKYIVYITFLAAFWFVLSSFTRQGFILISILLITYGMTLYSKFKYKKLGLIIVIISLSTIFYRIAQSEIFVENFIDRTQSQVDNDEGSTAYRAYLYKVGFEFINDNLILGIGPGNFLKTVGKDAHSGYLNIVSETGILSSISIIILIFSIFNLSKKDFFNKNKNMFFGFGLTILLAPIFKSIYVLPMFWSSLIVLYWYRYSKVDDN